MNSGSIPEAPEVTSLNPMMMSAGELQEQLQLLFGWLHKVEAATGPERPGEQVVQEVRDAANLLLEEQRERHSDESAPRGG